MYGPKKQLPLVFTPAPSFSQMMRLDAGDTLGFANVRYLHRRYAARPARVIQVEALVN